MRPLLLITFVVVTNGWRVAPSSWHKKNTHLRRATETEGDDVEAPMGPLKFMGLSVSLNGFVALLTDSKREDVLAVAIDGERDEATSPEALTMCQLFQDIDMAGTLLPPEALSIKYAEQADLSVEWNGTAYPFRSAGPWLRARCGDQLPQVELLRVVVKGGATSSLSFALHCMRSGGGGGGGSGLGGVLSTAVLDGGLGVVGSVSPFEAMALALRYRAKCEVLAERDTWAARAFPYGELGARYPLWQSEADALAQKARVTKSIAKSIESHKLEGALRVARERGDKGAEEKIRAALRQFDQGGLAVTEAEEGEERYADQARAAATKAMSSSPAAAAAAAAVAEAAAAATAAAAAAEEKGGAAPPPDGVGAADGEAEAPAP